MKKGLYVLLPLAGLMMAGIPFMASAADTLDMKASLAEGTCTFEGAGDYGVDFGELSMASLKDEVSRAHDVTVSGCPAGMTNVLITPEYTVDLMSSTIKHNGTAEGFLLFLGYADPNDIYHDLSAGKTAKIPITNGSAHFKEIVSIVQDGKH